MKIIEVKKISKKFGKLSVLSDVSLTVEKNQIISIIGPSGSGKSTLLRTIVNFEDIDKGEIFIEGKNNKTKDAISKVGMVFQNPNLFPNKTVIDNLISAPILVKKMNKNMAKKLGEYYLKKVNLLNKENYYPSRLSGGEAQRVAIARALVMQPDILLLDEPTSSLDPELVNEVLITIKKLAKEITILIVSHEIKFVKEISDKIYFMDKGKIITSGKPESIFFEQKNQRLKKFLKTFSYKLN